LSGAKASARAVLEGCGGKNHEIAREGQITDRFTKAIAQLGEQGPEKLAVRLGGIYALERIARDSERDHWPMMEVLTVGSEYEWNGKLGSSGSRVSMCRGETDIFARLNLRKLLRLNADSHNLSHIDTDACPHVGRQMGSDSQG
jgi:hypothetical protein